MIYYRGWEESLLSPVLMLKLGEMVLKGLNRARFEQRLLDTLRRRLAAFGAFSVRSLQSTVYVEPEDDVPPECREAMIRQARDAALLVFGLAAVTVAEKTPTDMPSILDGALSRCGLESAKTFKVEARRADKSYPLTSPQICSELGALLLERLPHLTVDVHTPEVTVWAEIREGHAYVHTAPLPGAGGLPAGMSGKAVLLLSGGIDSPVAGWRMARRGLELTAVHFHSYPYTSQEALEKVKGLARRLAAWHGPMKLYVVPFTAVQERMRAEGPEDYFTLLMRRSMARIASRIARREGCAALITGESLGQVASQTLEAMAVTGTAAAFPVFRPLVGMDKEEIVSAARQIGTFETSIQPFEDCCTVFTPRHPRTKPRPGPVLDAEAGGTWLALEEDATAGAERLEVTYDPHC